MKVYSPGDFFFIDVHFMDQVKLGDNQIQSWRRRRVHGSILKTHWKMSANLTSCGVNHSISLKSIHSLNIPIEGTQVSPSALC